MYRNPNIKLFASKGGARSAIVAAAKAVSDAEAIRELVEPMALDGYSLDQIAGQLNAWRVVGPKGGSWRAVAVARVLDRLNITRRRLAA